MTVLRRVPWRGIALGTLILLAAPFAFYAFRFGLEGAGFGALRETYLIQPAAPFGNGAISLHMILGGALTVLVPLQLSPGLRRRFPHWHRGAGRLLVAGALLTGAAGCAFILMRGTIGGMWMDAGFLLYGALMMLAAAQAWRFARAGRFVPHRAWALRLFVLVLGSWLYRVHYGLWYLATDGLASTPEFTGTFDRVQNVAFYLPYLVLLEIWLRTRPVPPELRTTACEKG